jgi:hypothetical protein
VNFKDVRRGFVRRSGGRRVIEGEIDVESVVFVGAKVWDNRAIKSLVQVSQRSRE